ncbi:MAG: hypothetical protein EXS47_02235 [Candidatus Zambryskibacteria bacterium]|nr:hypothetical protein [Candidatus Zambryskibacteria bacterium]
MNISDLKTKSIRINPYGPGCSELWPPVEVVQKSTGKTVRIYAVDETGRFPDHVRINEERGWWHISAFEFLPGEAPNNE